MNIKIRLIKIVILFCCIFWVGTSAFSFFYYYTERKIDISNCMIKDNGFSYKIDLIEKYSGYYRVKGWVMHNDEESDLFTTKLVLWNDDIEEYKYYLVDMAGRPDIQEDEVLKCGFYTMIDECYLKDKDYKIGFLIEEEGKQIILRTEEVFEVKG